jgi:hypothetical protein
MYSYFKTFNSVLKIEKFHLKSTSYASRATRLDAIKADTFDGSYDGKSVNL